MNIMHFCEDEKSMLFGVLFFVAEVPIQLNRHILYR